MLFRSLEQNNLSLSLSIHAHMHKQVNRTAKLNELHLQPYFCCDQARLRRDTVALAAADTADSRASVRLSPFPPWLLPRVHVYLCFVAAPFSTRHRRGRRRWRVEAFKSLHGMIGPDYSSPAMVAVATLYLCHHGYILSLNVILNLS